MYREIENEGQNVLSKRFRCRRRWFGVLTFGLMLLLFAACEEDYKPGEIPTVPYNPDKSVTVSSFSPEKGRYGTRLMIEGDNFGTDTSKIIVSVGGVKAKVISSTGSLIYCIVQARSYEGTIEVSILGANEEPVATAVAGQKFLYETQLLVSTIIGEKVTDINNFDSSDGLFDEVGGVWRASWLSYDPKNRNHLYLADDGGPIRRLDFSDNTITTMFRNGYNGGNRFRTIEWTLGGDTMIIATDMGGDHETSAMLATRNEGFMDLRAFLPSGTRQCNGASIHPVNGELYYNSYQNGQVYRYDWQTKEREHLFNILDQSWEFNIQIHPTGNYAYILVINRHYIMRTDYDWSNKTFGTPYLICGEVSRAGYADGVGASVRLDQPYQGAFVKNPDYAGRADEYDFFFCDKMNHCVRKLTPEGVVSTYAGRGSAALNSNPWGAIDGDLRLEARFDRPDGLIYDAENDCFYIGDQQNRRIRKIAWTE